MTTASQDHTFTTPYEAVPFVWHKTMHMKTYLNILQTSIILLIIGLNSYTMANGLRLGSLWGILLSVGSLCALGYCIHLFRKLKELDSEEEYENR